MAFAALLGVACSDGDGGPSGTPPVDDAPPSAIDDGPSRLRANAVSSASVALTWQAGSVPVDGYEIRRDGELIGTSRGTRFLDDGVASGPSLYEVSGRRVDALAGIDRSVGPTAAEVTVPDAATLATLRGGQSLQLDGALDASAFATLDAFGHVAVSGFQGDLFVIERLAADGAVAERRFLPGIETGRLLAGGDRWYIVGDDGEQRPVIGIDPDTLATRWTVESTALDLTGGCRFVGLLADGALSCRGFADDTLRIDADGVVGATAPGVRIPTGDRVSADDGERLVDLWALPASTVPDAFFPVYEWVSREPVSGRTIDRGRVFDGDPAVDFRFTVDAVGVLGDRVVFAGDVLANGCLRVCVESLPIPPYVDGHFVARVDLSTGRVDALQRLPFGERVGRGAGRVESGRLVFTDRDLLTVLDIDSLAIVERRVVGGEPIALAPSALLTRAQGDGVDGPSWFRFVR